MSTFPATNLIVTGIFVICLATLITGALIAVMSTRLIRCVCGLAICCVGLAGIYYFLRSPFLALMEILIYIGAVCVTIVFAIMLAEPDEPKQQEARKDGIVWGAVSLGVAAAVFWGLWQLGTRMTWAPPQSRVNTGSIADIGKSLLTTYSLAFEMISLALLVAILGALAISRAGRTKS
jgi:NADH:ubiquinone oxidoreductase subunit 6 (subunit J)